MKIWIPALAIVLGCASAASAAVPASLTTLRAIHTLTNTQARQGLQVAFEATVTYCDKFGVDLFVQDGNEAIYVEVKPNSGLVPGDRVLVRGKTRGSFGTDVVSADVILLHHSATPTPIAATFAQLIRSEFDCKLVTVHATLRSADQVTMDNHPSTYLRLRMDGGPVDATILGGHAGELKELLDAQVEVTGVVSGIFDSKMQLTGILLEVFDISGLKVIKRASIGPDALPVTPMDRVLSAYYDRDLTHRVRVMGTITYYQPGSAIVLQEGSRSLWISTHAGDPMRIGDVAEATGFPDAHYSYLALTDGESRDTQIYKPITPQRSTWRELATWNNGEPSGHQNDLVSIEGQLLTVVREASQDEFVVLSNGKLFTAIYRHPPMDERPPPIKQVPPGARIRITGICMAVQANFIGSGQEEVPFNILLRSFDDIAVVASPSPLSVHNLIRVVALLLLAMFGLGARSWFIERRVRRQTASLAYIEQRRGRILEDINGARPLAEIVEQITELVSFKLNGAPCWCQIADGAQLGNCPPKLTGLRIVQSQIPSRSGQPLGTVSAAFDPLTKPNTNESEALAMAAALAALAIETRHLYSDLIHRSEFDLLTDIPNRFFLEKHLDALIDEARQNASVFGLIYIDLDEFKQINDLHGHQAGDLFLQEAALRMKRQLRSCDMLARLGGDEFAVLVPQVHNRAGAEEIAQRLAESFNEPFAVEGEFIKGSASVGVALYPEDATSKDSLLSAADAAMYKEKHANSED